MGPNALDQENRDAQTCVRSGQISPGRRCVPRQWQCHQNTRSRVHRTPQTPSWLGLPALAGCGSLPQSVWLRYSPSQLLMQAARSDLCSRHQHGSAGHSAWCVIRVTQLCRISQVRRRLARDAGLVALAAAHSSSDLQLTNTTWMTRVLGHAPDKTPGKTSGALAVWNTQIPRCDAGKNLEVFFRRSYENRSTGISAMNTT